MKKYTYNNNENYACILITICVYCNIMRYIIRNHLKGKNCMYSLILPPHPLPPKLEGVKSADPARLKDFENNYIISTW